LSDSGTVHIAWHLDDVGDLKIEWRDRGGPAVKAPERQGFGTTIITRSIPYDLGGRAEVRYPLLGFEADFCVPARHVVMQEPGRAAPVAAPEAEPTDQATLAEPVLSGVVLLVEDSLIIAMDAEDILTRLGAERVVTAASLNQAMRELDSDLFEAAVLDVNLGHETSVPIANALLERGVPFIFATGYGEQLRLPDEHQGTPVVQKPYTLASVSQALAQALRR
jgi:CheY-like chemotaxis protein